MILVRFCGMGGGRMPYAPTGVTPRMVSLCPDGGLMVAVGLLILIVRRVGEFCRLFWGMELQREVLNSDLYWFAWGGRLANRPYNYIKNERVNFISPARNDKF